MSTPLARRVEGLRPFWVMQLFAKARQAEAQGRDIVHMEVGEPDFNMPPAVHAAAIKAIEQHHTRYSTSRGLPALREAISQFYADRLDARVSPERILITPGASGALLMAMTAELNPDDLLILTDPGYPCNRQIAEILGARVDMIDCHGQDQYQPVAAQVEAACSRGARMLLLATPSNPTGGVISARTMAEIVAITRRHGVTLVVDEIYQGLVYGMEPDTVLRHSGDCYVLNSFSKYFGMTGWRIGWLVAPEDKVEAVDRIAQNLFLAANTPGQHAALASFLPENINVLEQRREAFQQRRDLLLRGLHDIGLQVHYQPRGAFYIYCDVRQYCDDSLALANDLFDQCGVVATPGVDFSEGQGRHYLRFAYTTSSQRLEEGLQRLGRYFVART